MCEQGHAQTKTNNNKLLPGFATAYDAITSEDYDSTKPAAYLNYIVFDENFRVVKENSGALQVTGAGGQWNTVAANGPVTINQPGYIAVFASSRVGSPVFFDKVDMTYYKGTVLEENHYYPFGLTLSTITPNANERNNYKYQSIELNKDFDLEIYETQYRSLDPQLGRFLQADPLADKSSHQSPYVSMDDNPVINTDPDGRYSRFGAWWRNIAWDGNGTTKSRGEWGVRLGGIGKDGGYESIIQTKGEKHRFAEDYRQELKQDMQDLETAKETGAVSMGEDGQYTRTVDGKPLDVSMSGSARAKSFLNMIGPALFGNAPQLAASKAGLAVKAGDEAKNVTEGVLKPLGLGSTGRTEAANLVEQMAMKDAMANPQFGTRIMEGMKDSRWLGWTKMQYSVETANGVKAVVHYVGKWVNGVLEAVDDFKFK